MRFWILFLGTKKDTGWEICLDMLKKMSYLSLNMLINVRLIKKHVMKITKRIEFML